MLAIDEALSVIVRLIERSQQAGEPIDHTIIVVGGTALSAHGIRNLSEGVDLYVQTFSDDVVFQVERELVEIYGPAFKIDVTATENLWGFILLRDIEEHSPTYKMLEVAGQTFTVKALSIEDLFLLEMNAGREKDRQDLPLIAARTTPEALIQRFNVIVQWHGNKPALPGYADELVRQLEICYALEPKQVISQLKLPKFVASMLWETYYPISDNDVMS
ncbi:MAG: hypothetical protein WAW42_04435 [Candidatus Competibacteraceae bacterium]|jgi:hypothetical protein